MLARTSGRSPAGRGGRFQAGCFLSGSRHSSAAHSSEAPAQASRAAPGRETPKPERIESSAGTESVASVRRLPANAALPPRAQPPPSRAGDARVRVRRVQQAQPEGREAAHGGGEELDVVRPEAEQLPHAARAAQCAQDDAQGAR